MKGLRLTIARQTVSSILDTLGDDDFFNIIAVSFASTKLSHLLNCHVCASLCLFLCDLLTKVWDGRVHDMIEYNHQNQWEICISIYGHYFDNAFNSNIFDDRWDMTI